jgi:hypothetical protein
VGAAGWKQMDTPTPLDLCFFIVFFKNIFEIFSMHHVIFKKIFKVLLMVLG